MLWYMPMWLWLMMLGMTGLSFAIVFSCIKIGADAEKRNRKVSKFSDPEWADLVNYKRYIHEKEGDV